MTRVRLRRHRIVNRRHAVVAVLALTASLLVGGLAASNATSAPGGQPIDAKVNALVAQMTLQEKLEQIQLLPDFLVTDQEVKNGLGSVLSVTDPVTINRLQHIAVEQSRLHIPLLFAFDTIHGFRTIFPVPLGAASSFDPQAAIDDATIGARESAAVGLKQAYAPMVDVSHEPRWGRIVEGAGEDPFLGSVMAAARVKGYQGTDFSAPDKEIASVKHFAAYGQPEGGPRLQHDRHVRTAAAQPLPAAVQGSGRRRCRHGDVLVQLDQRRAGLRQPGDHDRHPQGRVGLHRFRRGGLGCRRRDAGVPAGEPRLR
jgi:beta-glucosidase